MAETVLLLTIKKIGSALANGAAHQASGQLTKYTAELIELEGSMGRVGRELRAMHAFLCQMDIRNHNNQAHEGWLQDVRKVVDVMENMADEYLYLVGQEYDLGCCFYVKKGFKKPRSLLLLSKIASGVKEIEKDLAHLFQTRDRWIPLINNGDNSSSNYIIKRSQDLASTSRSLDEEDLVGVKENTDKLRLWLTSDDSKLSVITLHGMGGLGKTTLAANVYMKGRGEFDCYAWVSISQTYCREDVLRNIIKEVFKDKASVPSDIETMDIARLEETLKNFLEQRKYLIILDDIWTPEAFDDLSRALIRNDKGSRLVITTREGDVARLAPHEHILVLEALPEAEAWDLFCKKAFSRDTNYECPADLKILSEHIVSQCKGLPLAIVSVGSLLRLREKTVEEWKRISDQLSWELIHNPRLDDIRNILYLSYIYLPTHLKSCFLYCSLFPEDYDFHRKKLVRLWVAEGFIEERGESTLEEVAEGYIKELVHRNMLQLVEKNSFGRIRKFKMHDILRELAIDLCGKDCFGVIYKEDKFRQSLDNNDARRLVIHNLKKGIEQSVSSIHRLRSVVALDHSTPHKTLLSFIAEKSRYMSVLELSGLSIGKIPDAIGDLFNLRHLGLRDTKVKLLPKSIQKLSNLLTLDLCRSEIQELPRGITKLKKLRHLFAEKVNDPYWRDFRYRVGVRIPDGLGNLRSLQTLQALKAQDESVRHLGELRELRSLRIWNVKGSYCGHLNESLGQMRFLTLLYVGASDEKEVLQLSALPPNLQKLRLTGRLADDMLGESSPLQAAEHNLYSLRLYWSQLREDPLPSLSRLLNLTELGFTRAYNGEKLVFLTGWFPKLKTLKLIDLPNLQCLEIHKGTMASLEMFRLVNLSSMVEVPLGIEFLMNLKYLLFLEITREFLTLLHECPIMKVTRWRYTLKKLTDAGP